MRYKASSFSDIIGHEGGGDFAFMPETGRFRTETCSTPKADMGVI